MLRIARTEGEPCAFIAEPKGTTLPTILVADDNSNIQKMVSLAFADQGIEVISVGNGEAAVRKLFDVRPDVVLADVFMPVRNGYEVCEFVKKDPRFAQIPVILLVGAFDPLDEKEARRVGADGVLKKPFAPPDPLIAMVNSALGKKASPPSMSPAKELLRAVELIRPAAGQIPPTTEESLPETSPAFLSPSGTGPGRFPEAAGSSGLAEKSPREESAPIFGGPTDSFAPTVSGPQGTGRHFDGADYEVPTGDAGRAALRDEPFEPSRLILEAIEEAQKLQDEAEQVRASIEQESSMVPNQAEWMELMSPSPAPLAITGQEEPASTPAVDNPPLAPVETWTTPEPASQASAETHNPIHGAPVSEAATEASEVIEEGSAVIEEASAPSTETPVEPSEVSRRFQATEVEAERSEPVPEESPKQEFELLVQPAANLPLGGTPEHKRELEASFESQQPVTHMPYEPSEAIRTAFPKHAGEESATRGLAMMPEPEVESFPADLQPDPALIQAVVSKVLEALEPEIHQILTREILKPLVENLLQRELQKK
jgi:CheY-like chemotaxis protein